MPSPLCKCWRVVVKGDAHPPTHPPYEIIVEERGGRPHSGGFGALDCLPPPPPPMLVVLERPLVVDLE